MFSFRCHRTRSPTAVRISFAPARERAPPCAMPDARIAVIGDHQPGNPTHDAIPDAVGHVDAGGRTTSVEWIATDAALVLPPATLDGYDGFWIAPGSPYRSMDGALRVIRHARDCDRPLLGTCAGFQHLVLELACDVLGIADAAHAEYDPDAPNLFVDLLACSLVGETMTVTVHPGTVAASLYPTPSALERYYCRFGLDPARVGELEAAGMVVSGVDQDGEPRIVEVAGARFCLATLFVPQTSSSPSAPHPIVAGFVAACQAGRSVPA